MKTTLLLLTAALAIGPAFAADPPPQAKKTEMMHASPAAQAALVDVKKTLGFVPGFLNALPDTALPGAWQQMRDLEMGQTVLPQKVKELIGLGVSAQIPCKYCVFAHTEFAKSRGASKEEIGLALSSAALTRQWATYLEGSQQDEAQFRSELTKVVDRMKAMDPNAAPPEAVTVTDASSAYKDMEQYYGFVPGFMKAFPSSAVAGAWKMTRTVHESAQIMPPKYVSLIALGVASQIPCKSCIVAQTEFARAQGANDEEINEAIGQASLTRNLSTLLNGLQIDDATFKADVMKMVRPKGKTIAQN